MPLYDYRCAGCGPFEARADVAAAGAGAGCPGCGAEAARAFTPPGGRVPRRRRQLQLQGFGAAALQRVDRAEAGAASGGALPAGARLDRAGRPRPSRAAAGPRRPWQLGH